MRRSLINKQVERVARALCRESGDDPDQLTYAHEFKCTGRDREPKHRWECWISFAEASIAAMEKKNGR